ncbi:hypothetical protein BH11MYX1_BH11MYX1_46670 [soil metagenome]
MNVELVAVELVIDEAVLASGEMYRRHLERAAEGAVDGAADARVIVFPELAGHLALYALAGPASHRAKTVAGALAAAAVRRPLEVLRGVTQMRWLDGRHVVLAALAPEAEKWWKSVFAPLARQLDAYVVAGSHLRLGLDGELTNASLLFAPSGELVAVTDKVNLNPGVEDAAKGGLGLARGTPDALPVTLTPFGSVATLIGYDAATEPRSPHERFASLPQHLARRGGVTVLANPAMDLPEGLALTLETEACARFGVTARLTGAVLDLRFEGGSEILERVGSEVRVLVRGGTVRTRVHATG